MHLVSSEGSAGVAHGFFCPDFWFVDSQFLNLLVSVFVVFLKFYFQKTEVRLYKPDVPREDQAAHNVPH